MRWVERDLRARDVSHLPIELRGNRSRHLDCLREYWQRGIFPRNHERPGERVPCFIDPRGRVCAVAHLLIADDQAALAQEVAQRFNYARVQAMDVPGLLQWADQSGLTVDELARIQPQYPWSQDYQDYQIAWLPLIQVAMALGVVTIALYYVRPLASKRTGWIVAWVGVLIALPQLAFALALGLGCWGLYARLRAGSPQTRGYSSSGPDEADPLPSPLQGGGGSPQTHAPAEERAAIGQIPGSGGARLAADQRGADPP